MGDLGAGSFGGVVWVDWQIKVGSRSEKEVRKWRQCNCKLISRILFMGKIKAIRQLIKGRGRIKGCFINTFQDKRELSLFLWLKRR